MCDRAEAIEYAKNLFDMLVDYGFDVHDPMSIRHLDLPDDVQWNDGCTRLVVWTFGSDYVIKIPLTDSDNKYCLKECELYRAAVEAGVEKYFGWCDYVTTSQTKIYVMEYLSCNEEQIDDDSYEHAYKSYCEENDLEDNDDTRDEFDSSEYENNEAVYDFFMDKIDDLRIRRAVDKFICDNDISDLHAGNWGYRGNTLVVCDYASFGW